MHLLCICLHDRYACRVYLYVLTFVYQLCVANGASQSHNCKTVMVILHFITYTAMWMTGIIARYVAIVHYI